MSNEGRVSTERRGHVLLIGLDRAAKRNAVDYALFSGEVDAVLEQACWKQ